MRRQVRLLDVYTLSVVKCFQRSFCLLFLDIVRYACEKSNGNTLNIKQKSRQNSKNRFGIKSQNVSL
jgi:hypothetical protein